MDARGWLLLLLLAGTPAGASEAEDLVRAGRVTEAVAAARREAAAAPDDVVAQERWIDLMLGLGLPEPVQQHYAARARTRPTDADAWYLVGRAATDVASSRAAYENALRFNPDHARTWTGLAALARVEGRLREAAELYQRALRIDDRLPEAWGGLLAVTLASEAPDAALAVARAARLQVPTLAEPYLVLAELAPQEAGEVLREGVRRVPWDARVRAAFAEQLLSEGDGRGALAQAQEARRLDPVEKRAILVELHARAMAAGTLDAAGHRALLEARALQARDPKAARAAWDALVARYPRCALPLLGRAASRANEPDGGRADLEKALAVEPSNHEAQAALGLLLREQEPARAARLLDAAIAARPLDASLALAAALAHRDAGDRAGALARLEAAERTWPLDLRIGLERVAVLGQLGRHAEAIDAARALAARIPDLRAELAVAAAAVEAGRLRDAADVYEALGKRTGHRSFLDTAQRLRERAAGGPG